MSKRKFLFREEYSREWPFIKKGRGASEAECVLCQSFIGIQTGGRRRIVRHLNTTKHRNSLAQPTTTLHVAQPNSVENVGGNGSSSSSSSSENDARSAKLALSEPTVEPRVSFPSMDCGKTLRKLLERGRPKRKCLFREKYSKEWPFIKQGRGASEAECVLCQSVIAIGSGGRAQIIRHINTSKHQDLLAQPSDKNVGGDGSSSSSISENDVSAAAELALSYHTVKHRMSFRSMDCANELIAQLLGESTLAYKFSCARRKTEAIITSILAPNSVKLVKDELDQVRFFGIGAEACDMHVAQTVYPFIVQYFTIKDGICVKLLNVCSLSTENPDGIADYCASSLERHKIDKKKCVAFSVLGRLRGRGSENGSIINSLKSSLHENIISINCPGHILHFTMKTAADTLSLDVEMIIIKLIDHFCVYQIQDDRLKEFGWFATAHHKNIQLCSKTVWMSLFPAIQMILKLFQPLKYYFLRQKCSSPKLLVSFFENPLGEVYLGFLSNQLSVFEQQILKLEGASSVIEIESVLDDTLLIIQDSQEQLQQKFVSSSTQNLVSKSGVDRAQVAKFYDDVTKFYSSCFEYLQKLLSPMKDIALFRWMKLNDPPEWNQVEKCAEFMISTGWEIDTSALFDEFTMFKKLIDDEAGKDGWNVSRCHEKWARLLRLCKSEDEYGEMFKLCEFIFSIPGPNSNVQQLFKEMNKWTDERKRMKITTLEAVLQCSFNYNMSCTDFYSHISEDKDLLERVKSYNRPVI